PLFVLFPLVVLLSKRRPNLLELVLAAGWMVLAIKGFRYLPLWVLIVVPITARASYGIPWVAALVDKHLISPDPSSLFANRDGRVSWGLASVATGLLLLGGSHWLQGRFAQLLPEVVDTRALDKLVELHETQPDAVVFHSYNWGGYLTWQGWHPHSPR